MVINPSKFLQIYKSNKKTDKIDAKKTLKRLRYRILCDGNEANLPTVYVPTHEVRELRSLFNSYKMLIKQKTMVKNRIHSLLIHQGGVCTHRGVYTHQGVDIHPPGYYLGNSDIFNKDVREAVFNLELPETIAFQLEVFYKQVDFLEDQVNEVKERILGEGKPFENEIDKLVSIKGVSVFIAIAVMSDIADINRSVGSKKLCSYLKVGVYTHRVPKVDASNKSEKIGCVNKCSRKLSIGCFFKD